MYAVHSYQCSPSKTCNIRPQRKSFAKGKQDEWNGMGSQNLISVEFLTQVPSFNTFTSGPLSVGILITRTYHQHNILLKRTVCYAQLRTINSTQHRNSCETKCSKSNYKITRLLSINKVHHGFHKTSPPVPVTNLMNQSTSS